MNKKLLLITLIFMSVFIAGCTNQTKTDSAANVITKETSANNNNNLKSSVNMTYQVVKNIYTNKKVTVNYPQINNFSELSKEKSINEIIKNEALKVLNYYKDFSDEVTLDINYTIKFKNQNLLSIQYTGMGYSKSAVHPNNLFYVTNINLNKGTRLKLADLVNVDEKFVDKFKSGSYKSQDTDTIQSLEEAAKFGVSQLTTADLIKSFNNADSLDNIGTENQSDTFSYFTKDSFGISVSVSHAAGDHAEFEIKYQDIQDNINTKNEVWKTLLAS
jgi:hypothetical protein